VGGFDPLLDDTVDFDCRLRHVGVPSTLRVRGREGEREGEGRERGR
jgi:acetyl esterase/lipase